MRLSTDQITTILDITQQQLGKGSCVSIYGSRLNDERKGGDLDLLIEVPERIGTLQRAELKMMLEAALQMPVDVLLYRQGSEPSAFQAIALAQAVKLGQAA
ncbi:nucleotidyltransferase family protein [Modicisalibacter muralis]|uniref:nucleotidyltransferase family protein n=1 Tax=Modicisalibacter muralis TaxID=119000 RepID=UPI000B7F4C14|nr:nucleotidyltransferase domain-containing protein [Halomonas muralis]